MKKIVKIQALKAREGKPQHMVVGRVYGVTSDKADILIKGGSAIKAKDSMEAGKVYDLPERDAAKDSMEAGKVYDLPERDAAKDFKKESKR